MGLPEFLIYASGPGIAVIVGAILSFVAEYWAGYEALDPKAKRLVMALLCGVVPLVATGIRIALGYMAVEGLVPILEQIIWPALVAALAGFGVSTLAHTRKLTPTAKCECK